MNKTEEILTPKSIHRGDKENLLIICNKHYLCRNHEDRERAFDYILKKITHKNISATPKRIKFLLIDSIGYEVEA